MNRDFLPISKKDLDRRGWDALDIILVTADAYVDHPSYGAAVIGRVLEDAGFRVGIIAQPDSRKTDDFKRLGRPRLFFGVTAGNVDSMVANYTANKKIRSGDDYSPGGRRAGRPDRATIIYTNRIREAFGPIPIIIGGIEASLRRFAHYDYWSDSVRRSILPDSKADILVYGMGEAQTLDIAARLKSGSEKGGLDNIRGTVVIRNSISALKDHIEIPSFEETARNKEKFNLAFRKIYSESMNPVKARAIAQRHDDRYVIQFPPAMPLGAQELDRIYELPYMRGWHPSYDSSGGVPGFETVRFSIISHRGCPGGCSFCSLYLHQGRIVQSRSRRSIIREATSIASQKYFGGTITDIGGPTANLYMAQCPEWQKAGPCADRNCLNPGKCEKLKLGYDDTIKLWDEALAIPKVKHLFIASGMRYDLLADKESDQYLNRLCARHISGRLKVAPEHSEDAVLALMNKPSFKTYEKFAERFDRMNRRSGKRQFLVNYFINAHPGSTLNEALALSLRLLEKNIHPEQIQDFLPLPMTISSCMYYTQKSPFTGKALYVPRLLRERKLQRALVQCKNPANRRYIIEALRKMGRMDLCKKLIG